MRRSSTLLLLAIVLTACSAGAFAKPKDNDVDKSAPPVMEKGKKGLLIECRGPWANSANAIIREFERAWAFTANGTRKVESVVLIFRMPNGDYKAVLQGITNEMYQSTFKWQPSTVAIVHTHPNNRSPEPEVEDRRIADKYGVPIYTITNRGMYVYDPIIKRTGKVYNSLDWLKPCAGGLKGAFSADEALQLDE